MQKDSFAKFKTLLKSVKNSVIVTHFNPDGDAMGSSLALYHYLKQLNKTVTIVVPNAYPEFLHWLPGNNKVLIFEKNEVRAEKVINKADCIFTLDFNAFKRLEKLGHILQATKTPKILIDHHQQPEHYAKYYFHDVNACSTCELIFDWIVGLGDKKLIDKKIAACLYTGLMTDTGSFRYPSVTTKTHTIVAELLKTGIVPSTIHGSVYDTYSEDRLKLVGFVLSQRMIVLKDVPVAFFALNSSDMHKFNYQKGDTEGLVNYPFAIKGIKVCAFFNETSEGYVKISLRSKGKIDVNTFARKYFNGGGHINAAGGKSLVSLEETVKKFESVVSKLF
jgi:phosphoesterase RecJ-like protein